MQEDPLIGRQLANYKIEKEIGHGGMAVVYYGWDVKLNRPAAIKVIDARFRDQPNYTRRFLQEARLIASWRHEHILQIYYADDASFPDLGKLFFFAMEYIDGQNLAETMSQSVQSHGNMPPADVLRYGRAAAEALDYAHKRGVIHRDVKPANILVSKDGRIVLSDFGLAIQVAEESVGEVFGSAHYMAPEQARRSSDAVPQSDLYSLGVILYEMLTGVVPFDDPSPTSVALQHITLPPPRPREINPDLSEEVESVLLKALAKKPEDRYAEGEDLMGALENALVRMHPSLPTYKNVPLALPETPPFPPADRFRFRWLQALSHANGKLVFAAVGLAVITFLALGLNLWAGRTPGESSLTATPHSAAPLPVTEQTTQAPSSTPEEFETAVPSATYQPTSATPQPLPSYTNFPTLAVPTSAVQDVTQPTITWTPQYANGRKMILSWNDSSFYMLQVTGYGELIDPLAFERLDGKGVPSNRFSGKLWAEFHSATLRNWCMRLEIGGPKQPADLPAFLRPALCEEHYLSSRWPDSADPTIFWTRKEGSLQFRVLWGPNEIQRCEIDAGTCEVYLP